MRLFFEVAKRSFQRQLSYRAATIAGLLTNLFFGLLRVAVLVALYGARGEMEGITLAGAITFTGLSQATIGFLSLFGWYDLMNSVYTGAVSADLLKPMDFYRFWMAQDLGRACAQFLLRGVTLMVAYALFFDIVYPQSLGQWAALALAMVLAWQISFAYRFLVNLAAFWAPNAGGVGRFAFIISWFMTGFFMPLRFFPDWFVRLCYLTPFPYTVNAILEIYLGLLAGRELALTLLAQVSWIVLLFITGQLVLRAGVRRLVILGG